MYLAPARQEALAAYDRFLGNDQLKYPRACDCLENDKDVLLTFYDFPAEPWAHLRTTNPIESTFATVRLRTRADQRVRRPSRHADHGLQAGLGSPKNLASAKRGRKVDQSHPWRPVCRRPGSDRNPTSRLVTQKDAPPPRTQHLTISLAHGGSTHRKRKRKFYLNDNLSGIIRSVMRPFMKHVALHRERVFRPNLLDVNECALPLTEE